MRRHFRDLSPLALFSLLLLSAPLLGLTLYYAGTSLADENSFLVAALLIFALVLCALGVLIWSFSSWGNWPRLLLGPGLGLASVLLTLPAVWAVGAAKQRWFLLRHGAELEGLARRVMRRQLSVAQANQLITDHRIQITLEDCDAAGPRTVLFLFNGLIDNCHGLAYSTAAGRPAATANCCGEYTSWEALGNNWYSWTTT